MRIAQSQWLPAVGWVHHGTPDAQHPAQLVLVFGARELVSDESLQETVRRRFPDANVIGCSTAGEICGTRVLDDSVVVTAIHFEHTRVRSAFRALPDATQSKDVGASLGRDLVGEGLQHVFTLAEGIAVNGSELVHGFQSVLPAHVAITGGLAGDGTRFQQTVIAAGDRVVPQGVAAVGFYGDRLRIGYGSMGGWDSFGPDRLITRAEGNVLYELDGGCALELYKKYLGPHAAELPASGLMFPLSLRGAAGEQRVVRTILSVDESAGSLTFAGDVPEGGYARLMKANVDRLIDGASGAADASYEAIGSTTPDLAILISCVGRKLVLRQRTEEEVESVRDVLGASTVLTGFYSYGEIAPFLPSAKCELHNQTMTITTLSER